MSDNYDKKKILMYEETGIKTWPEDCFLFSVFKGSENGRNWIADSNIPIFMTHDKVMFYPVKKQHLIRNGFDKIPFIVKYDIGRKLLYHIEADVCRIFECSINEGNYISGLFNRNMLLRGEAGRFNHVCYVYGYDAITEQIYMNDNFFDGKNSCLRISYENVRRAFELAIQDEKCLPGNAVLTFYKVDNEYDYLFSKKLMKKNLNSYLNSECLSEGPTVDNTFWGLDVYKQFAKNIAETKGVIDLRNVTFLHDIVVSNRVRADVVQSNIETSEKMKDVFFYIHEEEKVSDIIIGMAIKYEMQKKEEMLQRIADVVKRFGDYERIICEKLIEICE